MLSVKTLLSPLTREQIGFARCLGLNYADHAVCDAPVALRTQAFLTGIVVSG
jgi:hypothetical protein